MFQRILMLIVVGFVSSSSFADVEVLEFTDKAEWEAAVGIFETIDFTGSNHGEPIGDDYLDSHSVVFINATYWNSLAFPNDGWGINNNNFLGGTWATFDEPKMWIAADHPGVMSFRLFNNGQLVYESNFWSGSGVGNFSGLLSSHPFDQVYFFRPEPFHPNIGIDDIHFGSVIPAPDALGVLAIAGLLAPRRRRG